MTAVLAVSCGGSTAAAPADAGGKPDAVVTSTSHDAGHGSKDSGHATTKGDAGQSTPPTDATSGDAGCPAVCSGPGESCSGTQCVNDCRPPSASACSTPTVCDYTDGICRTPGPGVLTGPFVSCSGGDAGDSGSSASCGPGSACPPNGATCLPDAPCASVDCEGSSCWGVECPLTRPAPACLPAPLATMNLPSFMGPGPASSAHTYEGPDDIEFDDSCDTYVVTMISGPDYLRELVPDGGLTVSTGVTNLNMGQLAVQRSQNDVAATAPPQVGVTYTCCSTCGCDTTPAQGVARRVTNADAGTTSLPLVITATTTGGAGPFGDSELDSGPEGLTAGRDGTLYVGNVMTNGDYYRIDVKSGTTSLVTTFPHRVDAACPLDYTHLLVALENSTVMELSTVTGSATLWATMPNQVTSIKRDPFTGLVYAELLGAGSPTILQMKADGTGASVFQTPPSGGRIAIGPDGYLYHLSVSVYTLDNNRGSGPGSSVVRWPLPSMR